MTNGGFIFFSNIHDKNKAFQILNTLCCFEKKIFDLKNYKNNSIFYKINLKSKNLLNESDFKYKKKYVDKSLIKILKSSANNNKSIDINSFFSKNITFIKTTGVHVQEGLILHKNFSVLKKKSIENHTIFNYICKYFKIS